MDLHERVRITREKLGLTVAETARRAGLDYAHLHRFEHGARDMSASNLARLLAVLGLDVLPADHHGASTDTVAPGAVTDHPGSVT